MRSYKKQKSQRLRIHLRQSIKNQRKNKNSMSPFRTLNLLQENLEKQSLPLLLRNHQLLCGKHLKNNNQLKTMSNSLTIMEQTFKRRSKKTKNHLRNLKLSSIYRRKTKIRRKRLQRAKSKATRLIVTKFLQTKDKKI